MAKAKVGPEDEPDEEESPADGDEGSEDDGGDGAGGGDLESHIRAVVHEVIDTVMGKRPAPPAAPTGGGPRQDEAAILAMVKDAQGRLKAEEDKDARFEAVAGEVESLKKVVEKPPARAGIAGKVQAFLWGSE